MQKSLGFGRALGAFLVDFGMFLGPWTLDFECFVWARCYFSKSRVFHVRVHFFVILGGFGVVRGGILRAKR